MSCPLPTSLESIFKTFPAAAGSEVFAYKGLSLSSLQWEGSSLTWDDATTSRANTPQPCLRQTRDSNV